MSQDFLAVLNVSDMASLEKKKFRFPRYNIISVKHHAHTRSIL